jgi:hypothetical protein
MDGAVGKNPGSASLFRAYEIASAPPSKSYGWEAHIGASGTECRRLRQNPRHAGEAKNKDDFDERCYP